jgi:hypothetical protein
MNTKDTAKLFKALENFTSDDKTRPMLAHVFVPGPNRIEATDGHKLIRLEVKAGHGLATGFYDPKKAAATAKADMLPAPITQDASWLWPATDQVIPKVENDRKGAVLAGFNARYMAECMEGICGALAPWGFSSKSPSVTFRMGEDAMSPLRMDADAYGEATAVVVLMPMRV